MKVFIKAILAGAMIAFGGVVYIMSPNKVVGAFLFSMGLFTVLTCGLYLFTGKIGFLAETTTLSYAKDMCITLGGNLVGTIIVGLAVQLTRSGAAISEAAAKLSAVKIGDGLISIFVLGFFCGIMMFLATYIYKKVDNVGKYLAIIMAVMVFILSGFEHGVANMFYFTAGNAWSIKAVINMAVTIIGNSAGALVFCVATRKAEL